MLKIWCVAFVIGVCFLQTINGSGYVITTPRRWTSGAESQVCVNFRNSPPEGETPLFNLTVSVRTTGIEPKDILPSKSLLFSQSAVGVHCEKISFPETTQVRGEISILGAIGEATINYTKPISISTDVAKTFVQTDKYLYKPSQIVKFRILTVIGPKLKVSTEQYDEIYVENPSGTRIAQWLKEPNSDGLIHKEFQLSEEPEEGTYKIHVLGPANRRKSTNVPFKVEEYVLPTYKVTIKPPKYVLGTTKELLYKVCAKYTFGQPVKGKVTLIVHNGGWDKYKTTITKQSDIAGCAKFNITSEELKINGKSYFAYELTANAIVIEAGTDVELKAKAAKVDISRTALKFEDISTQKFYKPELVFVGEIKVTFPDDSAVVNELMNVCLQDKCNNISTNNEGILKFAVAPHHQDESIHVKAINFPLIRMQDTSWRSIMYKSQFHKTVKKYHSPSNSSLVIEIQDDKLQCIPGEQIKFSFPVSFSAVEMDHAKVAVQVISRGQILFASNDMTAFTPSTNTHINPDILIEPVKEPVTKNLFRGSFTKSVELPPTASPEAKLIIFYSRPNGEVVSDVRTVDITECLLNFVNLTWSAEKVQPGEEATLTMSAEPHSLCSLGIVDKSVQLLSSKKNDLTISKLLEIAEKSSVKEHENRLVDDYEYCQSKNAEDEKEKGIPDRNFEFPRAFPRAIARKKRSSPPRRFFSFYSDDIDALHMFDDAGIYVFSDMQLESRPCGCGYALVRQTHVLNVGSIRRTGYLSPNQRKHSLPRKSSPPLPTIPPVPSKKKKRQRGNSKPRKYLPETWLWNFRNIRETGMTEEVLTLPDTITEWVGSAVCVHPSKGVGISEIASITTFKDFFADLTLPATVKRGETFPVKISVFNYLKEPIPVMVILEESPDFDILADEGKELGSGERSSCLAAQDKVVHTIRIKTKSIGNVNITVFASVDTNSLSTCGSGTGNIRTDTLIKPIKVEIEGFEKDKAWTQYICGNEMETPTPSSWIIDIPQDVPVIPDSARGFISVVGNLMGPTIENLGKLVKMPYGCGEQNMLNFAPNIFVMPYFNTNATKELAENAIKYMKKGYQRELNYRHEDGSYSAFGKSDDSGSTWLTAFVLKCFAQARNYISIDANDVNISLHWLKNKQLENGCFESVGKVLHKGMKGGISKSSSPSLLTSFVLISLLEANEPHDSRVVRDALFCLKADTDATDSYALAIKAYALALARSPVANETLNQLKNNAKILPSSMYWELPKEKGSSVEVETAAYAVLALLTHDQVENFGESISVIQWMNNKRNGQGGFVSTQDTIVALQALSKFDELSNDGPPNADVFVEMIDPTGSSVSQEAGFGIDESNKLLQQKVEIPFFPAKVSFEFVGQGCSLIQAVLRYNEPEPEASEAFKLNVTTEPESDKNCATKRINACVSYTLPDFESNMGIIEVTLVSGYIPLKDDLKKIVRYGTEFFKRYEVDGNLVTFYVDKFMETELCASFRIKEEVKVEDAKPGSVKVYDYYKPEYYVTEKYSLPTECKTLNEIEIPFLNEIIPDEEALETTTLNFARALEEFDLALP